MKDKKSELSKHEINIIDKIAETSKKHIEIINDIKHNSKIKEILDASGSEKSTVKTHKK